MAKIRSKYFSISRQQFVDLNTNQLAVNSSRDIASQGSSAERLRLVRYGTPVNSSNLMNLIADLIYNDIQAYTEANKTISMLSDGIFPNILDEFAIETFDTEVAPNEEGIDETFFTKFLIKDGIVKINKQTYEFKASTFSVNTSFLSGSNTIFLPLVFIQNLKVGQVVSGFGIQDGTQVQLFSAVGDQVSVVLTKQTDENTTNTVLEFAERPVYSITGATGVKNIPDIDSIELGSIYRRDTVEIDVNGNFYYRIGKNSTVRPPLPTQLDTRYKVNSIVRVGENRYRVNFAETNRDFENELLIGDTLDLQLTQNSKFDGEFEIVAKSTGAGSPWVEITIAKYNDSGVNQTSPAGYAVTNKLVLYSVVLFRYDDNSPTIILDQIDKISETVGLDSNLQLITKAELLEDDTKFFGVKTKDRKHLLSATGEFLDWADGQSTSVPPIIGYSFNEEENQYGESLEFYDQTQISPVFDYDPLNTGSLINVPILINIDNNNIFGVTEVQLTGFNLGIRNTTNSIGDEGIRAQVKSADPVITDRIAKVTNIAPTFDRIIDSEANFTSLGLTEGEDFVLITEGNGKYQTAKILDVISDTELEIETVTKPILKDGVDDDFTSQYQIFKNSSVTNVGQEAIITAQELKSQAVSAVNGRFGLNNAFSKVRIQFPESIQIDLKKWYYICLKAENQNPPTVGQLPFIVVENPDSNISTTRTRQAYIEVFYQTFSGTYPNGSFLIEDEFGDISQVFEQRAFAPHFRPTSYKLIAVPLEESGDEALFTPTELDTVYVDVHSGRFRFHPKAKPRRVYVSYFKRENLNGNATDFLIKHYDQDEYNKTNTQDQFSKILNQFRLGAKFGGVSQHGGMIQKTSDGVKGTQNVVKEDDFSTEFSDIGFDNHKVDINECDVKYAKHDVREIASVDKTKITAKTPVKLTSSAKNGTIYSGANLQRSPRVGLNSSDVRIFPSSEAISELGFFSFKRFNSNLFNGEYFTSGDLFLDTRAGYAIDGKWNDIQFYQFDDYQIIRAFLRKTSTELLDYPFSDSVIRYVKQRESVKITDKMLKNVAWSNGVKASERFFSKQNNDYQSIWYRNSGLLYAYSEIVDTNPYQFQSEVAKPDSGSPEVLDAGSPPIDYRSHHSVNIDGNFYVGFVTPDSRGRVSRYSLNKLPNTSELIEVDSVALDSSDNAVRDNVRTVRVIDLTRNHFAVVTGSTTSVLVVNVLRKDFTLVDTFTIGTSSTLGDDVLFDVCYLEEGRIAIAYKSEDGSTVFNTFEFNFETEDGGLSAQTVVLPPAEEILSFPKIRKFSRRSLIIAYSINGKLSFKKFSFEGISEPFTVEPVIDSSVFGTGIPNHFDVIVNSNNDLVFFYSHRPSVGSPTCNFRSSVFREYRNTIEKTFDLEVGIPIANQPKEISAINLNSDFLSVTYKTNSVKLYATQIDGTPCRNTYSVPSSSSYTYSSLSKASENSMLLSFKYVDGGDDKFGFYAYKFAPDFSSYLSSWTDSAFETTLSISNHKSKMKPTNVNKIAFASINDDNQIDLGFVELRGTQLVQTQSQQSTYDGSGGAPTHYDFAYNEYPGTQVAELKTLLVARDNGASTTVEAYYNDGSTYVKVGEQTFATLTKVKIHQVREDYFILVGIDSSSGISIIAVNTTSLDNDTKTFGSGNFGTPVNLSATNITNQVFSSVLTDNLYIVCNRSGVTTLFKVEITTEDLNISDADISQVNILAEESKKADVSEKGGIIATAMINTNDELVTLPVVSSTMAIYSAWTPQEINVDVEFVKIHSTEKNHFFILYKQLDGTTFEEVYEYEPSSLLITKDSHATLLLQDVGEIHLENLGNDFLLLQSLIANDFSATVTKVLPSNTDFKSPIGFSNGQYYSYLISSLKIAGMDFRGKYLTPKIIWKETSDSIQNSLVGCLHDSKVLNGRIGLINYESDKTSIIYHSESFPILGNKLFATNMTIYNQEIYIDSEVFSATLFNSPFNFSSLQRAKDSYFHAVKLGDRGLYVFKDQQSGVIKHAFSSSVNDLDNSVVRQIVLEDESGEILDYSLIEILQVGKLEEDKALIFCYDSTANRYFHTIIDKFGNEVRRGFAFIINEFDRTDETAFVSKPVIDCYGFTLHTYVSGGSRRHHQIGIGGGELGIAKIVGKNNFEKVFVDTLEVASDAKIFGDLRVYRNAEFFGTMKVTESVEFLNNAVIENRLTVGKLDGRVPLGSVVAIPPLFSATNNGGVASEPPGIPASGVVNDEGFQRYDGAVIPSGANPDLVGKFTPNLSDDRFMMGAIGITTSPVSTDTGVNKGDNTVALTVDQIAPHDHGGATASASVSLNVTGGSLSTNSGGAPSFGAGSFILATDLPDNIPRALNLQLIGLNVTQSPHSHAIPSDGLGQAFDIRPKWMKVIYLGRVR